MAERRMFSQSVIGSDRFTDLSLEAQALYFHICLSADDDGFINSARRVCRTIGAPDAAMQELSTAGFIILFGTGVCVIVDWKVHNQLRQDRYKETRFTDERGLVEIGQDKRYHIVRTEPESGLPNGNQTATDWQPVGNQMTTNGCRSIDKENLNSLNKIIEADESGETENRGECGEEETTPQSPSQPDREFEEKKRIAIEFLRSSEVTR